MGRGGSATTPENFGSGAPSLGGSRWREPPSLRSHEWLRRRPLPSRPVATAGLSRTPCAREDTGPHGSVALRGGPQQHNTVATAREGLCHCSAPPGRPSHPWGSEGLCGAQGMGISPEPTALALSSLEATPWLTAGGRGKGGGGGSGEGGAQAEGEADADPPGKGGAPHPWGGERGGAANAPSLRNSSHTTFACPIASPRPFGEG